MTDQAPTISVIVPTYNRRERLHRTLSGLAQQQLDGVTFETIVVSDGSTDDTDEYLESSSVPIDVVALRQENSGPAAARNRGIRAARGELCVFIDDDIVPDPRLLVSHYEAHQESSGSLVTIGPMLTPTDAKLNPWVDWEQRMLYKQYDTLRDKSMQTTSRQFYTGNTAIRREHLVAAGGFDESFRRAEDVELAYRLAEAGVEFTFIDTAVGFHYAERSFDSWRGNAFEYGRNDVAFALRGGQPWMLPLIARQFDARHLLVRRLTRTMVRHRRLHRASEVVLRKMAATADAVGAHRIRVAALSGIYNFAYYQGVDEAAESIGGLDAILKPDATGKRTSRSAPDDGAPPDRFNVRVLFIHSATHDRLGADEWVHAQIIQGLDTATHDIHVACVTGPGELPTLVRDVVEPLDGVTVVPMDPGPNSGFERSLAGLWSLATGTVRGLASMTRLTWYVHRHRIDVIHTNDRPRDALAAVCIGKITGTTSVLHAHVLYGDWMSPTLTWAYRHADHVIAVSDFVREGLISAGLDPDRLFTAHNAIELHRWEPETEPADVRSEFGIPDEAPLVITVCRLFEEKGVAPLIAAIGEVRRRHPDIRLLVIGDEPDPRVGFLSELHDVVSALGLDDAVSFLGYRNDIVAIMAAADVFAMPSFEEPFGLVFAEAMAMRLPIIGLDNGGTREVVRHGVDGLLSAPGDHAALVQHLTVLVDDPDLRRQMGAAGRARVEETFTVERMISDVARIYRVVV